MPEQTASGWSRRQLCLGFAATAASLAGCGGGGGGAEATPAPSPAPAPTPAPTPSAQPNILLVIADDFGVDSSNQYSYSADRPRTPNLDALAASGIVFENCWATPSCTTTRATLITGQHGVHSGVDFTPGVLPTTATTLQRHLRADAASSDYQTAVIGKWHLGGANPAVSHPIDCGVGYYAGNMAAELPSYTSWPLVENGVSGTSTSYHTTKLTDLALTWVQQQSKPWFLWLAYAAPHAPFHLPPSHLHSRALTGAAADIAAQPRAYYLAAVEAMDAEIGRLLSALPAATRANTVVLVVGDNGTPNQVVDSTVFTRGKVKGTVYEGGIRVPLIVSGKGVSRANVREPALVNTTDFFATIGQLAGHSASRVNDGYSFLPLLSGSGSAARSFNYSEFKASDFDGWTARDANYKLIQTLAGAQQLYDLRLGLKEENDLLAGGGAEFAAIAQALKAWGDSVRS